MAKEPIHDKQPQKANNILLTQPPFIWPEARWHTKDCIYEHHPPFDDFLLDSDLISGVIVGAWDGTVEWLNSLMQKDVARKVLLVLIVYPACPTREKHLRSLLRLKNQITGNDKGLNFRLLPFDLSYGKDFERMVLPPTVLQAQNSKSPKTMFCVCSVGDSGRDKMELGSFNLAFEPDDGLRNEWRRWFQFIFSSSIPLSDETAQIPYLMPAEGDPAAAEMWTAFCNRCLGSKENEVVHPKVDPETGEILKEPDGTAVQPWDDDKTKLDPLAQLLQKVYSDGYLVTIDETTRIRPLAIPVKAALLGQRSERTVGALTQKQSFKLQILDEKVAKEIEKCRSVTDIVDLLSYLLSMGNRWIPEAAKDLFEKELSARNEKGLAILKAALDGNDISQFIKKRIDSIRKDLNAMYRQLGQGKSVPNDKVESVLDDIHVRLNGALNGRITPRAIYNRIAPPDLTTNASTESWGQPFSLLLRSARLMREALTDNFFQRRFKGLSFTEEDFLSVMDIFNDVIIKTRDLQCARTELVELRKIGNGPKDPKEKCVAVWHIITGKSKT